MKSIFIFIIAALLIFESKFLMSKDWTIVNNLDSNANSNSWDFIKSYDSLNILIVGSDFNGIPKVIISDDAGKSWKYILNTSINEYMNDTTLKFYKPYAVHFDKNKIFIGAYDNIEKQPYFLKSFDNGKTWIKIKTEIGGSEIFFNDNEGVIVGFESIFYSSDNGINWQKKVNLIPGTSSGTIEKVRFNNINEFKILMVDQSNKKAWICKTGNMGTDWEVDTIPYYCRYISFSFFDDYVGWVIGSYNNGNGDQQNDIILKTTDSGNTWDIVADIALVDSISNSFGAFDIDVLSKKEAIIVGSSKKVIYTKDGGISWGLLSKGLEKASLLFKTVKFLKPNIILACGWDNLVAKYEFDNNVSTNEIFQKNELVIYPNPVNDFLYFNSNQYFGKITIYSMLDKIELETDYKEMINVSSLPAGLYFIKVGNKVCKFLKN